MSVSLTNIGRAYLQSFRALAVAMEQVSFVMPVPIANVVNNNPYEKHRFKRHKHKLGHSAKKVAKARKARKFRKQHRRNK